MKKITIILALVLIVSTSFAFTGKETVSDNALKTFKSEYVAATDASWTITKDFYKVSFTMNDQKLFAYYSKSGEFLAVSRNISTVELPASLKKSLKKMISGAWVSDLFEISNHDDTSWFVTLETADEKIMYKSQNGMKWTVFEKLEK